MKCKVDEKMLALYVGGELLPHKARKIAAHIKQCSKCAENLKRLKWSQAFLKDKIAFPDLGIDFWQQLKTQTMTRVKATASSRRSFITPVLSRNRFAIALVSIFLIILSAAIIYIHFFRPTPMIPAPDKTVKEQSFVSQEKAPVPEAKKDGIDPDKRLADNLITKVPISPKISREQEAVEPDISRTPYISQEVEEEPMDTIFYYEDSEIKIIWIYSNKLDRR